MIHRRIIFFYTGLYITLYFAGTEAAGADVNAFDFAVYDSAYSLDVRLPGSFGFQMGMADIHARYGTFTADFAIICHGLHLLVLSQYNIQILS